MDLLGTIGDPRLWIAISLGFLGGYKFMPEKKKHWAIKFIFLVFPATGLGYGISESLKLIFKIPRPCFGLDFCPTGYSMPSSHATVAFSAFGTLGLMTTYWMLFLAFLVALSRVLLGVHTVPDIIVGSILGLSIAASIFTIYKDRMMRERRRERRGGEGGEERVGD